MADTSKREDMRIINPHEGAASLAVHAADGRVLLAIHQDGTVTGAVEDASDYTPTTEEVVNAFAQTGVWLPIAGYAELREAFDRWLAGVIAEKRAEWEAEVADLRLEAGKRVDVIVLLREDEAELARIRAEGKRQFTAAYRAQNGNVIALDTPTVVQENAAKTVAEFTEEDPEGPDYFVATRILPPWMPVPDTTGAES